MIEKLKRKLWSLLGSILYHTNSNIMDVQLWTPNNEASDSFKVRGLLIFVIGDDTPILDRLGCVLGYTDEEDYLSTQLILLNNCLE